MLEALFCLYTAWLLIEIIHAGYSRLIPHQWKGCYGPVCALAVKRFVRANTASVRDCLQSGNMLPC